MSDTVTISETSQTVTLTPSVGQTVSLTSAADQTVAISTADSGYTDTNARQAVSVTGAGLIYNSNTGVMTYAQPNLQMSKITDAGTSATLDVGTGASQIVQMTSEGKLPAVDGSGLTNLASAPTLGIADTNTVKIDSTSIANGEYAKFTANGLESKTTSEVLADIGAAAASHTQSATTITTGELGVDRIPAISTDKLTSGTLPVARGGTGLTALTTLLNSNTTKSDVGLGNVTNIVAQPVDAELTAIAGLTSAADKGIQFTGSGSAAVYDLTAAGKALLDDADASAQRTTLGLGTVAVLAVGTNGADAVQLTGHPAGTGALPAVSGVALTALNASNVSSGNLADAYVDLRVDHGVTFDGQGSVIAASKSVLVPVERAGVITAASLVGDASGSITITVKRYTPSSGSLNSATSLGTIALSSAQHARDTTLSGWTTSLSAGDVLEFVTTATIATVTRVTCKLKVELA